MNNREALCRECRRKLIGATYLIIGGVRLNNGNRLCLLCIDKHFTKDQGGYKTTGDFVNVYIKTQKPESDVADLRRRVKELEQMLEALTEPDRRPLIEN